jgi:phosphatidylinositol-bisphosphatase
MHLEGGKDIFVTVVGEFERSAFGCSIPALVNLKEPIREISPGKLIELEKGNMPMNHYDIPKELWFLVDRLYRIGMEKPLFRQSGLTDEIIQIRNWLDEIPNVPIPGSVDSVAEAFLLLLDSFPEPVVPFNLHLKCIDSCSNYSQAKQILKQMPLAHRNVFVYICAFLRELLLHSDKNGLDIKFLALLFGRLMLRDQNHHAKPNQKVERQKESFIYQFLVNDDFSEDF